MPLNLTAELVALSISALIVAGVIYIGPYIRKITSMNKTLRQKEAQLTEAQGIAKLGIFGIDFRDGSVWWSDELYRRYGYEKDEFTPTLEVFFDHMHPHDVERVRESIDAFRQADSGEVLAIEYRMFTKSGSEIHISTIFTPEKDSTGQNIRCRCVSQDVTERKQTEEALKRSHTLYAQAEQMGKLGYWEWDVVTDRIIACSEQYANIFDMTVDQVFAAEQSFEEEINEYIHEDDRERYKQVTDDAYERKERWDIEFRAITNTGKMFYVRELGEPEFDKEGTLIRTFGTLQDITEQKRVEEELRESRNFLSAIIEGAPDFIFAKDLNGRHTMVNSAFANILGKSAEEIIGKTNSDLYFPDHAKVLNLEDREVIMSEKTQSYENAVELDGSTRTLLTTKYIHFDSEGNSAGVLGISHDITDRKIAEEKIRHLAHHDELTGLATLRLGKDRFSSVIALARRNKTSAAVLYLDLDGFKEINDSRGHKAGDQVLIEVAERLTQSVRETDTVARLGGDEFIIVLSQATKETDYVQVAEKVIKTLARPIRIDDQEVNISTSIGIALFPGHGETPEALINKADEAMYAVKRNGKNNYAMAEGGL